MPRMQGKCYHRFLLWASWCIQLVLEMRGPKQAHGDCEDAGRQQLIYNVTENLMTKCKF